MYASDPKEELDKARSRIKIRPFVIRWRHSLKKAMSNFTSPTPSKLRRHGPTSKRKV